MPMMGIAEALREGIREEMRRDPTVFCLGEDIGVKGGWGGAFTVTLGLVDEFGPERILDTPPPFAPNLEELYVPSVQRIVDAVKALM